MVEYRIIVDGLVQGVGFRVFSARCADDLGIEGYVRNVADGSVEIIAQGEPEELQAYVARLWRGPEAAKVAAVDVTDAAANNRYRGFEVRSGEN